MNALHSIRSVDVDAEKAAKTRSGLYRLGYRPKEGALPVPIPYLRFTGKFNDQSEMDGYIDLATWMNATLPELEGIDWLSIDENLLPSLIADHPLDLLLEAQHAAFEELRIVDCVKHSAMFRSLPVLDARPGAVLIERVSVGNEDIYYNLESQADLAIPLSFVLGRSVLPLTALKTVGVGDVLLVENAIGYAQSQHKRLFEFEFKQESIMLGERLLNDDRAFDRTGHNDVTAGSGSEQGINALPIELSFVLLEKTVTLGELKAMSPGEIVALPPDQLMDVEIRANQQRFARGELVELPNGQFGVEIRTLWP